MVNEDRMKRILLSTVVLLAFAGGSARAQSRIFEDEPLNRWTYSAVTQLVKLGQVDWMPPITTGPITRYEFAVVVARWLDKHKELSEASTKENLQSRDIITALQREFEDELLKLSDWEDNVPCGGKVEVRIVAPPRYKLAQGSFLRRKPQLVKYKLTRGYFLRQKPQLAETRSDSPFKDFDTQIRAAVETAGEKN